MKTIKIGKYKYRLFISAKKETLESSYVYVERRYNLLFSRWNTESCGSMLYGEALAYLVRIRHDWEQEQINKKRKKEFADIPKTI